MAGTDPHIHVESKLNDHAAVRNVIASAFGLASDAPRVVTTGCGLRVPYAMTSRRPESVTCLPCREHAHRQHLRFAEQAERWINMASLPGLTGMTGMTGIAGSDLTARQAAQRHRDLAVRFSGEDR